MEEDDAQEASREFRGGEIFGRNFLELPFEFGRGITDRLAWIPGLTATYCVVACGNLVSDFEQFTSNV